MFLAHSLFHHDTVPRARRDDMRRREPRASRRPRFSTRGCFSATALEPTDDDPSRRAGDARGRIAADRGCARASDATRATDATRNRGTRRVGRGATRAARRRFSFVHSLDRSTVCETSRARSRGASARGRASVVDRVVSSSTRTRASDGGNARGRGRRAAGRGG